MQIQSSPAASLQATLANSPTDAASRLQGKGQGQNEMRKSFDEFLGETFYGQMLSSMRKTVGKPAYFDGGRAEEIFRGQLDQVISQNLASTAPPSFAGPMFELFALQHK